jgi:hypothetical protein
MPHKLAQLSAKRSNASHKKHGEAPFARSCLTVIELNGKIRLIADALRVHAESAAQGAFDLRGRVVVRRACESSARSNPELHVLEAASIAGALSSRRAAFHV